MARALEDVGTKTGEIVALSTGRTWQTVVACLGIWKAGCAYVFLDPECPEQHNRFFSQECRVRYEITAELVEQAVKEQSKDFFAERGNRERLAVVVYTSGSSGRSKGVRISQKNLTASVANFWEIGFVSRDHYCCFASMRFIAAVYDISLTLSIGATLYLIPGPIRKDIRKVAQYYIDNQITVTFLPPHMAVKYMDIDDKSPLRLLLSGSEPVRNLKKRSYDIISLYASSETCALASYYWVKDERRTYPVGQLVKSMRGYIVDAKGRLVPRGAIGELWVSGPQVSDGYLELPELTKERFCSNPFCREAPFQTLFRTGDMVRETEEGLVCCGRRDNMVKIRGFRVELTGVERYMLEYPGIKDACCTVWKDEGGTNLLFGYYIADSPIDHQSFREYLARVVPFYMIPIGLVRCESFPRTMNGKVQRRDFTPPEGLDDWKELAKRYY